jgi:hypothetical protein
MKASNPSLCRGGPLTKTQRRGSACNSLFALCLLIVGCLALGACVPGMQLQAPLLSGIDSPSAICRNSLSGCLALYGKEVDSAGLVLNAVLAHQERADLERALTECADLARSEVLLRHQGDFQQLSPTAEECNQLAKGARRRGTTWAQQLGVEMHEAALGCTEARLNALRPGRFSREPRYRYDSRVQQWKQVSKQEERALEESGNRGELRGSLVPDVVIHSGDPLHAQAVYDFKFPCVNTDSAPTWDKYPSGHLYEGRTPKAMYELLFTNVKILRIVPRLGVVQ